MVIKVAIDLYVLLYFNKQESFILILKKMLAFTCTYTFKLNQISFMINMKQDTYKVILAFAYYLDGTDSIIYILKN